MLRQVKPNVNNSSDILLSVSHLIVVPVFSYNLQFMPFKPCVFYLVICRTEVIKEGKR